MMRVFPMFLCLFLLLLFSGTVTYIYMLWNTYWDRVDKLSREHSLMSRRFQHESRVKKHEETTKPPDETIDFARLPLDKLLTHVDHYKSQIVEQLRNAVAESGRSVLSGDVQNLYNVRLPTDLLPNPGNKTAMELVKSAARNTSITTFLKGDQFFNGLQLGAYLPHHPLELVRSGFNSCAVVSSAGSLLRSGLGRHIDSNDYVIRFNNAPTKGYEDDVGKKTDLRIVNSQVVGKPEFGFLDSLLYQSPILVWDPSNYNSTLHEWYSSPDVPFFETYFAKRLMRPDSEVYLLHPQSLWSIWNWLQSVHEWPLLPNPPTSGFIGIMLAIKHCSMVHVYEFVPSMRLTKRCHYYDSLENLGCTIGDWHPLAAEKLTTLQMNVANDTQVFSDGYVTIPGLMSFN